MAGTSPAMTSWRGMIGEELCRRLALDRLPLAMAGFAAEEQGLAHYRRDHGKLERFCDQERRLRPLPGEETLRVGGDEDHRHFERVEELVDGIEARAAVGQLNVGQDQARPLLLGERDRL